MVKDLIDKNQAEVQLKIQDLQDIRVGIKYALRCAKKINLNSESNSSLDSDLSQEELNFLACLTCLPKTKTKNKG
ncbi:hypothetical phage protein [Campylobacter phage CP220]|uniref:Hypothetical phage protein n=1 Tax=Campylobacter phage CP220 TaxID=2994044 RepID=D5GV14_9CAUD|nr:hypothetical protein APL47_gp022 [Campylobacter phage CP220]CBJ93831.1 hypothetical phage protein [Campylobacter phage CP220]